MGCGRVAEAVRADGGSALHPPDQVRDHTTNLALVDPAAAAPEEESRLTRVAREHRPGLAEVDVEALSCRNAVGDDTLPIALAPHAQEAAALVDRGEIQADQFADADPRRVENLDQSEVADGDGAVHGRVVRIAPAREVHPFGGHVEQLGGVALGEHRGQGTGGARSRQPATGVRGESSAAVGPGREGAGTGGPSRHGRPGAAGLELAGEPGAQQPEVHGVERRDATGGGEAEQRPRVAEVGAPGVRTVPTLRPQVPLVRDQSVVERLGQRRRRVTWVVVRHAPTVVPVTSGLKRARRRDAHAPGSAGAVRGNWRATPTFGHAQRESAEFESPQARGERHGVEPRRVEEPRRRHGAPQRQGVENTYVLLGEIVVHGVRHLRPRCRGRGSDRLDEFQDVGDPGDAHGPLPEEAVAAGGGGRRDRSRDGPDGAPQVHGLPRRDRGPRPPSRLDHDGGAGEPGDEPITVDEPVARRGRPGRDLADDQALGRDPVDEVGVAAGVDPVHPAGQHRHRQPSGSQRTAVCRGVDAEGSARDDRHPLLGAPEPDLAGEELAVLRAGAGTDHGRRPGRGRAEVMRPPDPEAERATVAEPVQGLGPLVVAGDDEPPAEPAEHAEVATRIGPGQTRQPAALDAPLGLGNGEHPGEGGRGAVPADERRRRQVARFGEPAPGRPRGPIVVRIEPGGQAGGPRQSGDVQGHAATRPRVLSRSARPTWSRVGRVRPSRSASVQASRRTRDSHRSAAVRVGSAPRGLDGTEPRRERIISRYT